MTTEEWRAIPDWPNYEASSLGRIRRARSQRLLTQWLDARSGRYIVRPSRAGRQTAQWVHVWVAAAFHGPRPPELLTRHLNDDPLDNRADNLAYGTKSDNWHDAARNSVPGLRVKQTRCDRDHELVPPNLVASGQCRACKNARNALSRQHRHAHLSGDMQTVSDMYYAEHVGASK